MYGTAATGISSHVATAGRIVALLKVSTIASLITQAPHDDRGMVAVAQHHTLDTVLEGRNPRLHVRDTLVGVILQVGLVTTVETVVVKHRIHACGIRIVTGTYGIDVVTLHEQYILQHRLGRYGTSVDGVRIVAVHALEQHLLAIDIHERILYLDVAESMLGRKGHLLASVGILLHHTYSIQVRFLGRPHQRIGQFELCLQRHLLLVSGKLGYHQFTCHLLACRVVEHHFK